MKIKDFGIKRHDNDAVSVSVMVEELKGEPFNPILIYKPQGTKEPQYPMLPEESFVLTLQTKFQMELYKNMLLPYYVLIPHMVLISTDLNSLHALYQMTMAKVTI